MPTEGVLNGFPRKTDHFETVAEAETRDEMSEAQAAAVFKSAVGKLQELRKQHSDIAGITELLDLLATNKPIKPPKKGFRKCNCEYEVPIEDAIKNEILEAEKLKLDSHVWSLTPCGAICAVASGEVIQCFHMAEKNVLRFVREGVPQFFCQEHADRIVKHRVCVCGILPLQEKVQTGFIVCSKGHWYHANCSRGNGCPHGPCSS